MLSPGAAVAPLLAVVRASRYTHSCKLCFPCARSPELGPPYSCGKLPSGTPPFLWQRTPHGTPISQGTESSAFPCPFNLGARCQGIQYGANPSAYVFVEAWWHILVLQCADVSHDLAITPKLVCSMVSSSVMLATRILCQPTLSPSIEHIRMEFGRCFAISRLMACAARAYTSVELGRVPCFTGHGKVGHVSTRSCSTIRRSRCPTPRSSMRATRSRTPSAEGVESALAHLFFFVLDARGRYQSGPYHNNLPFVRGAHVC